MSAEAIRMQDLAYEFSNIFRVYTPDPTAGGGDPLPHSPPARLLAGRAAQAPRSGVGTQTLVPLNFSAVVAPLHQDLHHGTLRLYRLRFE